MGPDIPPIVSVLTPGHVRVKVNRVVLMSGQRVSAGMTCMLKPEDAAEVIRLGAGEAVPEIDGADAARVQPVAHAESPTVVGMVEPGIRGIMQDPTPKKRR